MQNTKIIIYQSEYGKTKIQMQLENETMKKFGNSEFAKKPTNGNGRLSRLVCDIILAKNGFPMIGLNLKNGDNYIEKVHQGYDCNYEPMKELLKLKIMELMRE